MTVPGKPTPIDVGSWFSPKDYPAEAQKNGREGNVRFEVDVGADGKPTACRIAKSSGTPSLDETTCRVVMARAKFSPAVVNGKPVAAVYSDSTTWRLEGSGIPTNGYFAVIIDYAKDPKHPQCSIVQKGVIGPPGCDQMLSRFGQFGIRNPDLLKYVALMSVTKGEEEPYRGEAEWGHRDSFTAVDLYQTKDGKRSCVVIASQGDTQDPEPCAMFKATDILSDAEKKTAVKQHLEKANFVTFRPTAGQNGACKGGESASETHGCN